MARGPLHEVTDALRLVQLCRFHRRCIWIDHPGRRAQPWGDVAEGHQQQYEPKES